MTAEGVPLEANYLALLLGVTVDELISMPSEELSAAANRSIAEAHSVSFNGEIATVSVEDEGDLTGILVGSDTYMANGEGLSIITGDGIVSLDPAKINAWSSQS